MREIAEKFLDFVSSKAQPTKRQAGTLTEDIEEQAPASETDELICTDKYMSLTRNDNLKEKNDSLDYLNDFQFPEQTKFSDLEDLIDQFFHSNIENSKSNEQENSKTQVDFLERATENYGNNDNNENCDKNCRYHETEKISVERRTQRTNKTQFPRTLNGLWKSLSIEEKIKGSFTKSRKKPRGKNRSTNSRRLIRSFSNQKQKTSKPRVRKKIGCFYVADVYSESLSELQELNLGDFGAGSSLSSQIGQHSEDSSLYCSTELCQIAKNCVNESIENNENNEKGLLRKRNSNRRQRERTMSSQTADSSTTYDATTAQNQTDYFENVDEVTPYPAIRHQLHRNYSLNNHENRRERSSLMKTSSLPRALNAHSSQTGGAAHGTSPLLQSRSRFSLHKQGTIDTDVESVLFKRTPFDLMKKNASLLTNIICLAITLSLVLVTVVQFSNNEERWDSFSQRVNKVSADVGQAQELVTQQTFSVQEMEYLLFGNKMDGELSFKNLTDAGKGVINTMLVMKKWYNDHAKMLENLADQSKQLLKAKNAVLGSGSERGVNHRLKQLTIDIAKTSELLIHEKSDWNTQFDTMSEEFKFTNKLVEDYLSNIQNAEGNISALNAKLKNQNLDTENALSKIDAKLKDQNLKIQEMQDKLLELFNQVMLSSS